MAARTRLAQFLTNTLAARDETPEQFARRAGINSSGLYKLLRGEYSEPRQGTIEKIAAALSMTAGELLAASEVERDDPFEAEVLVRTAQFREVLRDVPHGFCATILKATLDRAVESARDMAQLLMAAETSGASDGRVSSSSSGRVIEAGRDGARADDGDVHAQDGGLPNCKNPVQRSITAPLLRAALA